MQTLMRIIDSIRPVFVFISRFLFWIVHFALRFVARIFLLVALAGIIIIPTLAAVVLISIPLPDILQGVLNSESVRVLAFLVTLGAFATFSNFFGRVILHSLDALARNLIKTLGNEWIHWKPAWTIGESLSTTGQQIAEIGTQIWKTLKTSGTLVLSVLIGVAVLALAHVHTKESAESLSTWQQNITKGLKTLEEQQATLKDDFTAWQEKVTAMHPSQSDTLEEPLIVYSLAYPEQGKPDTKEGICPDSRTSEWLNEFKAAIVEYSQNESRLQLEVRGFSSVAPVPEAGNCESSNQCNCDIANERAEAVVGFLTSDDSCENFLSRRKWQSPGDDPCIRPEREFRLGLPDGLDFDVTYRPWQSYEEMTRYKPINDGPSGGQRRAAVEFLSRGVQIMVKTNPR